MTKGQVEKAERIALNQFDKWNDVTGLVGENTSYQYELQALIKEAVHIGIQMSINGKVEFDEEGNVKTPESDEVNSTTEEEDEYLNDSVRFSYWLMENCELAEDNSLWVYEGEDYTNEGLYQIWLNEK